MQSFFGQYSADTGQTVLSYWLNKAKLFNDYQDETPAPHLSQSAFYSNFEKYFGPNRINKNLPFIKISIYSSHSVCNVCVQINTQRRQCRTEEDWRRVTALKNQHKKVFGEARRTVQELKQSSLSCPADNLFLQVLTDLQLLFE